MLDNIVTLRRRPKAPEPAKPVQRVEARIFACGNCGHDRFILQSDGVIRCPECGLHSTNVKCVRTDN